MITPPTDCFYVVEVHGEAAEFVTATLSMGAIADIKEALLISEDFATDIEATVGMDNTVQLVKDRLEEPNLIELIDVNPLYVPSTAEELDSVLDGEEKSETCQFVGMDGNPFSMKMIRIMSGDEPLVAGSVLCKPFDLPTYGEIIAAQGALRLN